MTATRPDEVRFYLDESARMMAGRTDTGWLRRRSVRVVHGVMGALLLALSAYEFATEGASAALLASTNLALGLAFLATALDLPVADWLWGRSPLRPFLAIRPDGVTVQAGADERTFKWGDLAAVERQATKLVLVPREGAPTSIAFSALSYERVQEVHHELITAALRHGIELR